MCVFESNRFSPHVGIEWDDVKRGKHDGSVIDAEVPGENHILICMCKHLKPTFMCTPKQSGELASVLFLRGRGWIFRQTQQTQNWQKFPGSPSRKIFCAHSGGW